VGEREKNPFSLSSAMAITNPAPHTCYACSMTAVLDVETKKVELMEAMKVVRDPEIPVNIVDLGLIYNLELSQEGDVGVDMTLTSMGCPVQDMLQADVELACKSVEGIKAVTVNFVWSPPWSTEKMSDDGKKMMRMFGFHV
jgi:metal-sulfur cluster biosynthetic enzyme